MLSVFFFFMRPAPTATYPLPLPASLPLCRRSAPVLTARRPTVHHRQQRRGVRRGVGLPRVRGPRPPLGRQPRSEEHTSELQSRQYLVCRLLLEKKKKHQKMSAYRRISVRV